MPPLPPFSRSPAHPLYICARGWSDPCGSWIAIRDCIMVKFWSQSNQSEVDYVSEVVHVRAQWSFSLCEKLRMKKTNWSLRIADYKCEVKNFIILVLLRRRLSATCAIGANFTFATAKTSLPKATSLRHSRNFTALHAPQFYSPHSFFYPQRNLWLQFMNEGQFIASSRCNPAFRIPKKTVILG